MPRLCTICTHSQRVDLESAVLAGTSIRATAKAHSISWSSLQRHMRHVPAIVAQRASVKEKQAAAAGSLKGRVEEIIADIRRIAKVAEESKNVNGAITALRAQLSCLELLGRLSGELRNGAGEFVPSTAAAGAAASASVTVNMPVPEKQRSWEDFDSLLRQIYSLGPRPAKKPPVM